MTVLLKRTFCVVLMLLGFIQFMTAPSRATDSPYLEEWIFEVVLPPFLIADGVTVYQLESQYYMPVRQLAEGFEFFIEPSQETSYVKGWYVNEENSFVVDGNRNEIILKGERRTLDEGAILDHPDAGNDDVYIQLDVLNDIWPITMQIDLQRLSIAASAAEDLAFQERLERSKRREKFQSRKSVVVEEVDYIPVENGYKVLGKPVVDIQSTFTLDEANSASFGNTSVSGAMQFMGTLADFSASFPYEHDEKIQRPDNIRVKFSREAIGEEDMVGGLRSIQAGDVNVRHRNLIDGATAGRGFVVSSQQRGRNSSEFDLITIEGSGPPEWEIELYNNNELIEFGEVGADGEYLFEDVSLRFGNNRIRIVFYGPQGQVREEVRNYNIGGIMQSPGDFTYQLGLVDADRDFILLENSPRTQPRGVAANLFSSYGLTNEITLFGSYTKLPTDFEERQYYTIGSAASLLGGTGTLELYKQQGGGEAIDTRFITSLAGVKLNIRNTFFYDFESPSNGFGQGINDYEGQVEASRTFRLPFGVLGLTLNALHEEQNNDRNNTDISFRQTFSRGGVRFANTLNTDLVDKKHQQTSGQANTTIRLKDWQIRGGGSYELYPERELTTAQVDARYRTNYGLQASANFQHNFIQNATTYGSQIGYDFEKVLLSLDAQYEKDEGFEFVLRASTSLYPYTTDGSYAMSSTTKKNLSPYKAYVFRDFNGDGVYDADEDEPIEGVVTRANGARSRAETGEDGLLVHQVVGRGDDTVITLDPFTLDDPFLRPNVTGFETKTIRGTMPEVAFPVIMTGSIDGIVSYPDGRPTGGLPLELVSENEEVVGSTITAFDGLYTFEFIEPGQYTIRSSDKYSIYVPPYTVTVTPEDLFQFGIDLTAMKRAQGEPTAVLQDGEEAERGAVAHIHPTQPVKRTYEPASYQTQEDAAK